MTRCVTLTLCFAAFARTETGSVRRIPRPTVVASVGLLVTPTIALSTAFISTMRYVPSVPPLTALASVNFIPKLDKVGPFKGRIGSGPIVWVSVGFFG